MAFEKQFYIRGLMIFFCVMSMTTVLNIDNIKFNQQFFLRNLKHIDIIL